MRRNKKSLVPDKPTHTWQRSHLSPITLALQSHWPVIMLQTVETELLAWQPQAKHKNNKNYLLILFIKIIYLKKIKECQRPAIQLKSSGWR